MKIIAITSPKIIAEDAYLINRLIELGVYSIHLRKPEADINECRELLNRLNAEERGKIVIHNFPELCTEYSLKGIHINKHVLNPPKNYSGFKTRSCHSLEELKQFKDNYDYLFLSRIFDGIYNPELKSQFSTEQLQKASADGIIDEKVIALGGVTFDKLPYLKELNFGGAAMIDDLYNPKGLQNLIDYNSFRRGFNYNLIR